MCLFLCTDPFLAATEDQEGLYAVLLQVRVPLPSKTRFHLVVPIKILQSGFSDVDPPKKEEKTEKFGTKSTWAMFFSLYANSDFPHPALPPASMWLASVTSFDHTSNCHFLSPSTPQCTRPLWIPTRMLTLTPVTSRTSLQTHRGTASPLQQRTNPARVFVQPKTDSRYGLNHVHAHLDAAVGVVGPRLRQTGHAVITIAQNLDPQTVVFLGRKVAKVKQTHSRRRRGRRAFSLPTPTCQNGQRARWVSWPAPEPCTARPGWWNPRCLRTKCWDREREGKRERDPHHGRSSIHPISVGRSSNGILIKSTEHQVCNWVWLLRKTLACARVCVFAQCRNWMCAEALHLLGLAYLGCWWLSIPSLVLISLHTANPPLPLWIHVCACLDLFFDHLDAFFFLKMYSLLEITAWTLLARCWHAKILKILI